MIAFPTAAGFAHEWERQMMVQNLAHLIGSGRIKLYTPESTVSQCLTNKTDPPDLRVRRLMAYEDFVMNQLVPFIRHDCQSAQIPIGLAGASLGGYYAANYALKHPQTFDYALCMSGRYLLTHFTGGFSNGDVYFNNPLAYAANMAGECLDVVRAHTHVSLVCGQGPYEEGCIEETIMLADMLQAKGIPHTRDIWGKDTAHDWTSWRRQSLIHLTQRYG
ncbi:MAG: esterase [Acidobacteria bacterium]|nr:esterase [Acidobacteriota bacterium]